MTSAESTRAESVRDILGVFGAITRAVHEAEDPEMSAAAEELMPGLTANPDWYGELERRFPGEVWEGPDLQKALTNIAKNDKDAGADREKRLTRAQKARLLYGISASARLSQINRKSSLPAFDQSDDSDFGSALIGSLAAIAPTKVKSVVTRRKTAANARGALLQHISENFTRAGEFDDVVRAQVVADIRDNEKLLAPLCQTAVTTIDGYESVIVDTKFTSDAVSLDDLKAIVNPFNWAKDYADLFVEMRDLEPDIMDDGWRRVLETVRLLGSKNLTTPLKFFPSEDPKGVSARLDYDLDMTRFKDGDEQVRVDRGFINMKSTAGQASEKGVRVATRKVVHIEGISAFAQARLVCLGGYGTASADFLLGAAAQPPADPKPFKYPKDEDEADRDAARAGSASPSARASATTHFVPAAVDAWTECAQDLTNGYFDVAQKWLSGSLTVSDLADYTTRVSSELASSPWKYLQAMTTPRSPGKPGSKK